MWGVFVNVQQFIINYLRYIITNNYTFIFQITYVYEEKNSQSENSIWYSNHKDFKRRKALSPQPFKTYVGLTTIRNIV